MRIRDFDFDQDFEAVLQLWRDSGPGVQLGPSDEPAAIRHKLARDPDLFVVAEEGGRLIGAVMGGYDGRRGLVYHLAVANHRRRLGLGRQLMEEIERRLKAKGCHKCYLLVTRDNPEGLRFYEALGWEIMDLLLLGKVLQ